MNYKNIHTVINEHTDVVTPINSIDWDKEAQEVRSKIEELRKMEKEKTSSEALKCEYFQKVRERFEGSDESFDNWREKYGEHLLYLRRFWITGPEAFSPI